MGRKPQIAAGATDQLELTKEIVSSGETDCTIGARGHSTTLKYSGIEVPSSSESDTPCTTSYTYVGTAATPDGQMGEPRSGSWPQGTVSQTDIENGWDTRGFKYWCEGENLVVRSYHDASCSAHVTNTQRQDEMRYHQRGYINHPRVTFHTTVEPFQAGTTGQCHRVLTLASSSTGAVSHEVSYRYTHNCATLGGPLDSEWADCTGPSEVEDIGRQLGLVCSRLA